MGKWVPPSYRGPRVEIEGAMQTPDGAWLVEAIKCGSDRWYRVMHDNAPIDRLSIATVRDILAGAGVDIADLIEVHTRPRTD